MFTSVDKNTLTLKLVKMFYVLFRLVLINKISFQQIFRPNNSYLLVYKLICVFVKLLNLLFQQGKIFELIKSGKILDFVARNSFLCILGVEVLRTLNR